MVKKSWWKLSLLACIGCCAVPVIAGITGGIAAISADVWICSGVLIAGTLIWYIIKRRQMAKQHVECCNMDCSCKQKA